MLRYVRAHTFTPYSLPIHTPSRMALTGRCAPGADTSHGARRPPQLDNWQRTGGAIAVPSIPAPGEGYVPSCATPASQAAVSHPCRSSPLPPTTVSLQKLASRNHEARSCSVHQYVHRALMAYTHLEEHLRAQGRTTPATVITGRLRLVTTTTSHTHRITNAPAAPSRTVST